MKNYILDINPVAFSIGPINIYWYGLAYMAGMVLGLFYALKIIETKKEICRLSITKKNIDGIFIWIVFGIIFGARLGYVIFYNFDFYLNNPFLILSLWEGGMSFHGGAIGVIIAIISYSKYNRIPVLETGDIICSVVPIGLFFGRIANFVNGELWGKETNFFLGVIFPNGGKNPRHPTQLYEAFFEGVVLFLVLLYFKNKSFSKRPGFISGIFLVFYSIFRFAIEFLRVPDDQLGYLLFNLTMGQLISIFFLIIGCYLLISKYENKQNS